MAQPFRKPRTSEKLKFTSVLKATGDAGGTGAAPPMAGGAAAGRRKTRQVDVPEVHIVCNTDEALSDARVLQTELAIKLKELVTLGMPDGNGANVADVQAAQAARVVAILLTKNALHSPSLLVAVYHAAVQAKLLIPVCLPGRGYDYKAAKTHLTELETS